MPKYKVTCEIVTYVEAENEGKAREIAPDSFDWGNSEITVEEVEEDA